MNNPPAIPSQNWQAYPNPVAFPSATATSTQLCDSDETILADSEASGSDAEENNEENENSDDEESEDPNYLADLDDEEFWEEDAAADAWLLQHPGGSLLLYPELFVVKQHKGKVLTPSRNANATHCIFTLPPEIRNQIYEHYFNLYDEVKHPEEDYAPFLNHSNKKLQRIYLSSDMIQLRF
jgi:hypothetical protein